MRISYIASLALLASITVFGAGCSAATSDEPTEQGAPEALSTASAGMSQDLLCAVVAAADDNFDGSGLTSVEQAKLKGDALHDFKSWQRNMVPDYPSQAFDLPVKLGTKTYTFVMVVENNDGGGSVGVYKTDGTRVATDEYSESEGNPWSSPADKCKSPEN